MMKPAHMVVVALETGQVVEGKLQSQFRHRHPLSLYLAFQASAASSTPTASTPPPGRKPANPSPPRHNARGLLPRRNPCTRLLRPDEIKTDYESNTGHVIVERFKGLGPIAYPAVLVASHGPFTWGVDVAEANHNAAVLEYIARLAADTLRLKPGTPPMQDELLDKHFFRKHGPSAHYGQTRRSKRA